jgi:hypothetical protein
MASLGGAARGHMNHVIRWIRTVGATVIALSSCDRGRSGASGQSVGPSKPGAPAGGSATPTRWDHVAALARPAVPPGKSEHLAAALVIALRNDEAWLELSSKDPHPPLAEYPEGAAAVAELESWARDKGGLVPATSGSDLDVLRLMTLGGMATEAATPAARASLDAAAYLGYRLVVEGRDLVEGMLGTNLLQEAVDQAHRLGVPVAGWQLPTDHSLVRLLAGEALNVSPEGNAEFEAWIVKLTGNKKALAETRAAREQEIATMQKLWLGALGDARSSDTDRATVERVKQAGTGNALWDPVSQTVEDLARKLDRVRASSAEPSETPPGR